MTARVGVVGAGQLARMMQQAAIGPGIELTVLANTPDESAAQVTPRHVLGSPDDLDALRRLAESVDVVTFDHELVEPAHLEALVAEGHVLRPGPETLGVAVNKLEQRERFAAAGMPLPAWAAARGQADAATFAREHGWPVVVKSARGGYDGRGVWICNDEAALDDVPWDGVPAGFVVEEHVAIERELAGLVVRRPGGELRLYPMVETIQRDGICHEVVAPARVPDSVATEAERITREIAQTVGSVGNLAVELFVTGERVLINEIAARPHNSGHFSIEGAETSQFENHLRAVLDWPLGETGLRAPAAAMVNVLGSEAVPDSAAMLGEAHAIEGAHVHWYGKASRPGRKIGHVTALGDDRETALGIARSAAAILGHDTRSTR